MTHMLIPSTAERPLKCRAILPYCTRTTHERTCGHATGGANALLIDGTPSTLPNDSVAATQQLWVHCVAGSEPTTRQARLLGRRRCLLRLVLVVLLPVLVPLDGRRRHHSLVLRPRLVLPPRHVRLEGLLMRARLVGVGAANVGPRRARPLPTALADRPMLAAQHRVLVGRGEALPAGQHRHGIVRDADRYGAPVKELTRRASPVFRAATSMTELGV